MAPLALNVIVMSMRGSRKFFRGVPTLTTLFCLRGRTQIPLVHYKRAIIGPLAIQMAFRWRADDGTTLNAGLVASSFLGDPDQYCWETLYFCDFPGGGGGGWGYGRPAPTPLDPRMISIFVQVSVAEHAGLSRYW